MTCPTDIWQSSMHGASEGTYHLPSWFLILDLCTILEFKILLFTVVSYTTEIFDNVSQWPFENKMYCMLHVPGLSVLMTNHSCNTSFNIAHFRQRQLQRLSKSLFYLTLCDALWWGIPWKKMSKSCFLRIFQKKINSTDVFNTQPPPLVQITSNLHQSPESPGFGSFRGFLHGTLVDARLHGTWDQCSQGVLGIFLRRNQYDGCRVMVRGV